MGNCCTPPIHNTANSQSSDARNSITSQIQKEERRVILPDYSSSGDGRRSEDDGSNNDEEEVNQYEHIDQETRAAYIGLLKFKRANGYPDLKFADLLMMSNIQITNRIERESTECESYQSHGLV